MQCCRGRMDLEPDTESASSLMCCSWPGRTSARSGATPRDSLWPASERWTVSCWRWLPTSLHLQHHRGRPDNQGHHEALQDQGGVWQAGVVYKKNRTTTAQQRRRLPDINKKKIAFLTEQFRKSRPCLSLIKGINMTVVDTAETGEGGNALVWLNISLQESRYVH